MINTQRAIEELLDYRLTMEQIEAELPVSLWCKGVNNSVQGDVQESVQSAGSVGREGKESVNKSFQPDPFRTEILTIFSEVIKAGRITSSWLLSKCSGIEPDIIFAILETFDGNGLTIEGQVISSEVGSSDPMLAASMRLVGKYPMLCQPQSVVDGGDGSLLGVKRTATTKGVRTYQSLGNQSLNTDFLDILNSNAYRINWALLEQLCAEMEFEEFDLAALKFYIEQFRMDDIYYTHKFDARGRVYTNAYLLQLQGKKALRAAIQLAV